MKPEMPEKMPHDLALIDARLMTSSRSHLKIKRLYALNLIQPPLLF